MRVRVLTTTRLYWNYAVREIEKGTEIVGDLARHLHHNAEPGAVEIIDPDPDPEPDRSVPAEPLVPGQADGDVPADGTIDTLMGWVGDNPDRAAQALAAENARDKPRATVIKRLAALTSGDD